MIRLLDIGVLLVGALVSVGPSADAEPLLEEVFPDGLPFPFERTLEKLAHLAGEDAVQTALIPLGRSLQRYSAAPDFFASPRVVVAVTGDRVGGPDDPRLADRLYLGYQPAAGMVEAISYDEAAGEFVFHEILDYGAADHASIERADPQICLRCHQGGGPIFARPLWGETNANARVAARLSALGEVFHGAAVHQNVDAPDSFDTATDRAARIGPASLLWAEGCPDPACRAGLLADAVRYGLGAPLTGSAADPFRRAAADRWPAGLSFISPDLPNRDPMAMLATTDPDAILEPTGPMDAETPRAAVRFWHPGPDSYDDAVEHIATLLGTHDFSWIEQHLAGVVAATEESILACDSHSVELHGGGTERRFVCSFADVKIGGFVKPDLTGRIEVTAEGTKRRTPITTEPVGEALLLHPKGRSPRLPDGRRIAALRLDEAALTIGTVADLPILDAALIRLGQQGDPAFGPRPFQRRALLRVIGDALKGGGHG